MRLLSLFSGIGGIDLGLKRAGMTTVAQCEIDPFCNAVLAKHWPNVVRYTDVRALDGTVWRGRVDIVAGGFPCQDVSTAGKGAGVEGGKRSGLWFEMLRIVSEVRPAWVLAENVPALRTRGGDRVLADLGELGYAATTLVVGAWAVGAPHRRDRVWIVGHRDGIEQGAKQGARRRAGADAAGSDRVADADGRADAEGRELHVRPRGPRAAKGDDRGTSAGLGYARHGSAQEPQGDDCEQGQRTAQRRGQLVTASTGTDGRDHGGDQAARDAERRSASASDESDASLADAALGGCDSRRGLCDEPQGARSGRAEHGGSHADGAGCGQRHASSEPERSRLGSWSDHHWPAGPSERQHDWEEPRLAHAQGGGRTDEGQRRESQVAGIATGIGAMADSESGARGRSRLSRQSADSRSAQCEVGRSVDGLPARLVRLARRSNRDALRAYGNSVVPQVVEAIGRAIMNEGATP